MLSHVSMGKRAGLKEIQATFKAMPHDGMLNVMHAMELRIESLEHVLRDQ